MTAPDYSKIGLKETIVSLEDGVLVITINRAKERNMFGNDFALELIQTFDLADRDDRVRVIIVTAEASAPAYCSGADISGGWGSFFDPQDDKEGESAHRDMGGQVTIAVHRCRKITIAAVNGHAAGVGMTAMQLPFDLRLVWGGAKLSLAFIRRGIVPDATSSYLFPRLIGHSRANSLLLTGPTLSPTSPLIANLYHEIIPQREAVFPAALALAKDLAMNTSQVAVAYTKGLLQHPGDSLEENHILDSRAIKLLGSGKDAAEGVLAFKERRAPKFLETLSQITSPWYPWWRNTDVRYRKAKL